MIFHSEAWVLIHTLSIFFIQDNNKSEILVSDHASNILKDIGGSKVPGAEMTLNFIGEQVRTYVCELRPLSKDSQSWIRAEGIFAAAEPDI